MVQRKHDFQAGTRISSDQVDEEFNNLVNAVNQVESKTDNDLVPYSGASKDLNLNDKKLIGVQWLDTSDINRDGSYFRVGELDDGTFVIRSFVNGKSTDVLKITKDGKSSLTIVRPDGYVSIENGMMKNQYSMNSHYPEYVLGPVQKVGIWMETSDSTYTPMGLFFVKHEARYLVMSFFTNTTNANVSAAVRIVDNVTGNVIGYAGTTSTDIGGQSQVIMMDLGVPTGARKQIRVELRTQGNGTKVRARIMDKYLEN